MILRPPIVPALLAALLLPAAAGGRQAALLHPRRRHARGGERQRPHRPPRAEDQSAQQTRREGRLAPAGRRPASASASPPRRTSATTCLTRTSVEIVDERYVGVVVTGEGGVSIGVTASVFDARKAKRLHRSQPCDADDDDFRGPDDVVFLPRGGMAFICGPLWLFRTAPRRRRPQLEPASAGAALRSASPTAPTASSTALYWTLGDGTVKSLDLS